MRPTPISACRFGMCRYAGTRPSTGDRAATGTLSTAMQALKLGFIRSLEGSGVPRSRNVSESWGTPHSSSNVESYLPKDVRGAQRFWQNRFYDFNVWTEKKRIEKLRYIHR